MTHLLYETIVINKIFKQRWIILNIHFHFLHFRNFLAHYLFNKLLSFLGIFELDEIFLDCNNSNDLCAHFEICCLSVFSRTRSRWIATLASHATMPIRFFMRWEARAVDLLVCRASRCVLQCDDTNMRFDSKLMQHTSSDWSLPKGKSTNTCRSRPQI